MLERLYITTEEYFALPHASNSGVKDAFALNTSRDVPRDPDNRAYKYGSALDALLTDPTVMDSRELTGEEKVLLHPMLRSLEKNNSYNALFKNADRQAVWVEGEFPISYDGLDLTIPAKCKFDWWINKLKFGGDLKTSESRTLEQFISAAKWFNYDQQAAWYMDITGSDRFLIIGISKWNFKTFEMAFKRGDANYLAGREKYMKCALSWWKYYGMGL